MRIDFETRPAFRSPPAPPRRPAPRDAAHPLLDALHELGGQADVVRHEERPWASITFSGTRHDVTLVFAGVTALAAGEAFIAALPDHDFAIPGQLVADAAIVAVEQVALPQPCLTVTAELLLLEEA